MTKNDELTLRVVELYYLEGLTQAAIGQRVGLSRWRIGRLLDRAKEIGLVQITINHPRARNSALETELINAFGVTRAVVVPSAATESDTLSLVAARAAAELLSLRPKPTTFGLSWGRTMSAVVAKMPFSWNPGVRVVQTNGGVTHSADDAVSATIGAAAAKGPGRGYTIPAPAIVTSEALRKALSREPAIAKTLAAAAAAEVIAFAPGVPHADSVLVRSDYLRPADIARLRKQGAVGDVLSHFIDAEGNPIDEDLERRTLSISLADVRAAKNTIAVACGLDRADALAAVMRAGYAKTIIADSITAMAALATLNPKTAATPSNRSNQPTKE